jgi:hypothetical protein
VGKRFRLVVTRHSAFMNNSDELAFGQDEKKILLISKQLRKLRWLKTKNNLLIRSSKEFLESDWHCSLNMGKVMTLDCRQQLNNCRQSGSQIIHEEAFCQMRSQITCRLVLSLEEESARDSTIEANR